MLAIKKTSTHPCLSILCLAGLVIWLTGCTPPGPKALLNGEKYLSQGKYERAVEELSEATALLPQNAQGWNHLGLAYHGLRKADLAEKAYRQAIKLDLDLDTARFNLGVLYLEVGQYADAARELKSYTQVRHSSLDAHLLLGTAQLRARQWDDAGKTYARSYKLNPKHPDVLNGLGLVQMELKEYREAVRFFEAILKDDTKHQQALLNLAILSHTYVGNKEHALKLYREYLMLAPKPDNYSDVEAIVSELFKELNPKPLPGPKFTAIDHRTSAPVETNAAPPTIKPPVTAPDTNSPPKTNVTLIAKATKLDSQTGIQAPTPTAPKIEKAPSTPVVKKPAVTEVAKVETKPKPAQETKPTKDPDPTTVTTSKTETPKTTKPEAKEIIVTPPSRPKEIVFVPTTTKKAATTAPEVKTPKTEEKPKAPEPKEVVVKEQSPLMTASIAKETLAPATPAPEKETPKVTSTPVTPAPTESPEDPTPTTVKTTKPEPTFEEKVSSLSPTPVDSPADSGEKKKGFFQRLNPANLFKKKERNIQVTRLPGEPAPTPRTSTPATVVTTPAPTPAPTWVAAAKPALTPVETKRVIPRYVFLKPTLPTSGDRQGALVEFKKALEAHREQDYSTALTHYRTSAEKDGSLYEAHYNLGAVALRLRQLELALTSLEKATTARPSSSDAQYNFARALQMAGYPLDAVDSYERAIQLNPDNANAHLALGGLHAGELNAPTTARKHYNRFLELNPNHPKSSDVRYWIYRNQ